MAKASHSLVLRLTEFESCEKVESEFFMALRLRIKIFLVCFFKCYLASYTKLSGENKKTVFNFNWMCWCVANSNLSYQWHLSLTDNHNLKSDPLLLIPNMFGNDIFFALNTLSAGSKKKLKCLNLNHFMSNAMKPRCCGAMRSKSSSDSQLKHY